MKQKYKIMAAILAAGFLVPVAGLAATGQKTLTGVVTKLNGNQITIRATSAASYTAETSQAQLVRKNGAPMGFGEIIIGDKLEIKGRVWSDNSVNAYYVRNMSLYAHNSTFSGKIVSINPSAQSFVMQSKQYGAQTIRTDSLTSIKKNTGSATFQDLEIGFTAAVKAAWDRSYETVLAKGVKATYRLVNITVTGTVASKTNTGLSVVGNGNVIYGVDITKAKLQNKSGKTLVVDKINLGDTVRVEGKHISESVKITASLVKDMSVAK